MHVSSCPIKDKFPFLLHNRGKKMIRYSYISGKYRTLLSEKRRFTSTYPMEDKSRAPCSIKEMEYWKMLRDDQGHWRGRRRRQRSQPHGQRRIWQGVEFIAMQIPTSRRWPRTMLLPCAKSGSKLTGSEAWRCAVLYRQCADARDASQTTRRPGLLSPLAWAAALVRARRSRCGRGGTHLGILTVASSPSLPLRQDGPAVIGHCKLARAR